ncbi:PREDICTED: F-box/FBD/LRR-repeat protein At3g26920-like [Camelina sativa]|uniref:F-box/FBD/LRR-repeat protein At3g26920-like n=1 Tax=Camelina sativa TaxID=90675 RepID=A0ABM1RM56_CAMSA|nr:PREDICTED: F-box/FBD/LRR-repeat protein At3g26920-like [Camelina sativa]
MSVLAKRWRSLWKMMPCLDFEYSGRTSYETFSNNVCRCLLSHQAPVLQSLDLWIYFTKGTSSIDIGILVGTAFGLHVRKLVLNIFTGGEPFKFPSSLYNCETLETLELGSNLGSVLVDVPSPVCRKSLRTLRLIEVDYKDDESIINLLSGCINLENLVVNLNGDESCENVETFTIAVPSLQRLTIIDYIYDSVCEINAPSLKYLKIEGLLVGSDYCLTENVPGLVEADIAINGEIDENILGSLTSVKRLSLKVSPLEVRFSCD